MEFTERSLVLRVGRFREQDMWVRLLSPSQGLITAFAFGGCRSRKRFPGCLNSLGHVLFRVSRGRKGYFNLEEGVLLNGFSGLKAEPDRLGMASNCCNFLQAAHIGNSDSSEICDLVLQVLESLEEGHAVSALFPLLFRARVAFAQGYSPVFDRCSRCNALLDPAGSCAFHPQDGRMVCKACTRAQDTAITAPVAAAMVLSRLKDFPPRKWMSWEPPREVRYACFQMVEALIEWHLGLRYNGKRYVRC